MTRILDALRKVSSARTEPLPMPASPPAFDPSRTPALAAPRPLDNRPVPPVLALPLAGRRALSDDELQEMSRLRVNLEAALPDRPARVIAFVSPQAGDGTSDVALQFASALAGDERIRAVIVDANAQSPTLIADPEHRVIRRQGGSRHDAEGVALNLHGWAVSDAVREAGLFQPGAARAVFESLATTYDWVILDLPPVLESPDAAQLSAIADGTVLIVRAGRSKRPIVSRSVDLLRKAGARVLGSVLNRRRLEIPSFIYKRI